MVYNMPKRSSKGHLGLNYLADAAWTYDAAGNRKTDRVRGGSQEWEVNANNQITKSYTESGDILTPTWDENGSLIKQQTSANAPQYNQSYTYDAQNRLIEVKDNADNRIAYYQYDPMGRRIAKTTAEGTIYYLYNDQGLIAEAIPTGAITTEYGWRTDSTWSTDPLTITTTRAGGSQKETFHYLNDHLGTPQQVIDSQGQPVWQARASAFGENQVQPTSVITNNLRFPGQYYDSETNTHYNFFRDYDPTKGTYRQEDPIGLAGGLNLYQYVNGNPLMFIDPEGLMEIHASKLPPNFRDEDGKRAFRFTFTFNCNELCVKGQDWLDTLAIIIRELKPISYARKLLRTVSGLPDVEKYEDRLECAAYEKQLEALFLSKRDSRGRKYEAKYIGGTQLTEKEAREFMNEAARILPREIRKKYDWNNLIDKAKQRATGW